MPVQRTSFFATSRALGLAVLIATLALLLLASRGQVMAAPSLTVTTTTDAVDANPGDGVCATASGDCALRAAVQEANASVGEDLIYVPTGLYTLTRTGSGEDDAVTGDLDITDDLVIVGDGEDETIINGGDKDRVLQVLDSAIVTIKKLTIENGHAPIGGGILNSGTLTIQHAMLRNNSADSMSDIPLIQTAGGGAIFSEGIPGALELGPGNLTLSHVTISGNSSGGPGGGVDIVGGSLTIRWSSFRGNHSDGEGGGLFAWHRSTGTDLLVDVRDSEFNENLGSSGGGVFLAGTDNFLTRSNIQLNTGGGLFVAALGQSQTLVTHIKVIANSSESEGGGISIFGHSDPPVIENSLVAENTSTSGGGGVDVGGRGRFTNSIIRDNTTHEGDGGGVKVTGEAYISGTEIVDNQATVGRGGGIYHEGALLELADSDLTGNAAVDGGGIFVGFGPVTVTDSTVTENAATEGYGGGLFNAGGDDLYPHIFTRTMLNGNRALLGGGGIYNNAEVQLDGSEVNYNATEFGTGGGIQTDGRLVLTSSEVSSNEANTAGGISNYQESVIEDSEVRHNRAVDCVGGIYLPGGSSLAIRRSVVSENVAGDCIGGIGALVAESVELDGVTVLGNIVDGSHFQYAHDGCSFQGAGIANVRTPMIIRNSTISQNGFTTDHDNCVGGGIFNQGTLSLINSTLTGNFSLIEAGGVLDADFEPTTLELINTLIAGNDAPVSPDVSGTLASLGHNLIGIGDSATGLTDGVNGDVVGTVASPVDPLLGPLADNGGPTQTHILLPGSLAIDAGDSSVLAAPFSLTADQRGFARQVGLAVDIGAVEVTEIEATPAMDISDYLIPIGYKSWRDRTPQENAPYGTYTIVGTGKNGSDHSFRDLSVVITDLTGSNLILNCDSGGPTGTGCVISIPDSALGPDGLLSPDEEFSHYGVLGIVEPGMFTFEFEVWGKLVDDSPDTWWTTPQDVVDIPEGPQSMPVLLHAPEGVPTQYFGVRNGENCNWLTYSVSPAPSRPDHSHGVIAAGETVVISFNAASNSQRDFHCTSVIRLGSTEDLWAPTSQISREIRLDVYWINSFD